MFNLFNNTFVVIDPFATIEVAIILFDYKEAP